MAYKFVCLGCELCKEAYKLHVNTPTIKITNETHENKGQFLSSLK
jgi:hypothetical protein